MSAVCSTACTANARKDLNEALDNLARITEHVAQPKGMDEYYDYFVTDRNTPAELTVRRDDVETETAR